MATTTNYGWTTPDDTALVKDGAAAIRTLGSSVDTTTKALNPSTTLGDIEYRSATANTNTRLGIGTAGQVLQVNSGATAPEWATPAAPGLNYTLLNAGGTTLSGDTTVSGISGKSNLLIYVDGATNATQTIVSLRLNADSTANYVYAGSQINGLSGYGSNFLEAENSGAAGTTAIPLGRYNDSPSALSAAIRIDGASTTGFKSFNVNGSGSGTANQRNYNLTGIYEGTAAITSITIRSAAGSFTGGKVYVYGA
jgi:hypothetical protein